MSQQDEPPISGSALLLVIAGAVLAGLFLLRWVFATISYLLNTALVLVVVAGVIYVYLRVRADKT